MPQPRPQSSATGKAQGTCSVCHTLRYLHLKDGCVHVHGERGNRCSGSNQPPLSASQVPTASVNTLNVRSQTALSLSGGGDSLQPDPVLVSISISNPPPQSSFGIHCPEHRAVIKYIPRAARTSCASHLAKLFKLISSKSDSVEAWQALFNWPSLVLALPKRGGKRHNLTAMIKKHLLDLPIDNLAAWPSECADPLPSFGRTSRTRDLASAVAAKMEDGNIRAAVRILCSDDRPAEYNADTLRLLELKHPPAPPDRIPCIDTRPVPISVTEEDVLQAIRSFPPGSSGGPDGFRPQHLVDIVKCVISGPELLAATATLVNTLLSGSCHPMAAELLFGDRLIALNKKSGGIRPIAVGFVLRKMRLHVRARTISRVFLTSSTRRLR